MHIANLHAHALDKDIAHTQVPCCQYVDSSTWSAYHRNKLVLSNNCVSMSSTISSMRLVTLLAEKGTCSIFLTATSPRSSRQRSLVEGKINSLPIFLS